MNGVLLVLIIVVIAAIALAVYSSSKASGRRSAASLADAKAIIEAWRHDYNQRRPHGSLGHLTPTEYVRKRQERLIAEAAFLY